MITLGVLGALVAQLNDVAVARPTDARSGSGTVLGDARNALLAFAANHPQRIDPVNGASALLEDRPGGLPCPAPDAGGLSQPTCDTPASRIGLFPWRTLGFPVALRADGELLWYALAEAFRAQTTTPDVAPGIPFTINFDSANDEARLLQVIRPRTPAEIAANRPARDVASDTVAIVIAPGPAIAGQARPLPINTARASRYLERENAKDVILAAPPAPSPPRPPYAWNRLFALGDGDDFNDRGIVIRTSELFAAVEPVIEQRLRATVVPAMRATHRVGVQFASYKRSAPPIPAFLATIPDGGYGAYPYPVPWDNPSTSAFRWNPPPPVPAPSTEPREGLLPMRPPIGSVVQWDASPPTAIGDGGVGGGACVNSAGPVITMFSCNLNNPTAGPLRVRVTARIRNAGFSFLTPLRETNFEFAPAISKPLLEAIVHGGVSPGGVALVDAFFMLPAPPDPLSNFSISVSLPQPNPALAASTILPFAAPTGWFIRNEWFRFVYYAVTQNGRPGGAIPCVPSTTPAPPAERCLRVRAADGSEQAGEVALLLMGSRMNSTDVLTPPGQTRPSSAPLSYLDLANNAAGAPPYNLNLTALPIRSFDHMPQRDRSNDRLVVIAP